jgi:WD40 repeat protein
MIDQPRFPVRMVAFTPDGRALVIGTSASAGDAVHVWDVADWRHPRELSHFTDHNGVYSGEFGPDGHTLALAEEGRKTSLWNLANPAAPQHLYTMLGQASSVYTSTFSRDGRLLASGGFDKTAIIWDVSDPRAPHELVQLSGFPEPVASAVFSPDGKTLAISGGSTPTLYDISYLHYIVLHPVQAACAITGGGLSPAQWRAAGIALPYQPTC